MECEMASKDYGRSVLFPPSNWNGIRTPKVVPYGSYEHEFSSEAKQSFHSKISPLNFDNDVANMIQSMPLEDPCEAFHKKAHRVSY
jgi:hypothetical protein